jgi:hypothetical protein
VSGHAHQGGERYEVLLEAMPFDTPPAVRLRWALKHFLRSYRLRCCGIREVTPRLPSLPPAGYAGGAAGRRAPLAARGARRATPGASSSCHGVFPGRGRGPGALAPDEGTQEDCDATTQAFLVGAHCDGGVGRPGVSSDKLTRPSCRPPVVPEGARGTP